MKLTKGEFCSLVEDRVRKALAGADKNNTGDIGGIDISKIDIKVLKQAYRDLRLTPVPVTFDDDLSFPAYVNEAYGDILSPDDVVRKISTKYKISTQLVQKVEANNKISIYIIVALIGENVDLIKTDMEKMGYFLGLVGKTYVIEGMKFVKLQFEPTSQMQNDETDNIKSMYGTLYHWTPEYNMESVLSKGLVPSHKNSYFNYPPRTYLMREDCGDREMLSLGQKLCLLNRNPKNNGSYVLLAVDIKNVGDNVRLYYDSNSAIGIYTEQTIPSDKIHQVDKKQFSTKLNRK